MARRTPARGVARNDVGSGRRVCGVFRFLLESAAERFEPARQLARRVATSSPADARLALPSRFSDDGSDRSAADLPPRAQLLPRRAVLFPGSFRTEVDSR